MGPSGATIESSGAFVVGALRAGSIRRLAAAAACVLAYLPAVLPAQTRVLAPDWKRGYNGFRALCGSVGLQPTDDHEAWRAIPPKQKLLVAFGVFDPGRLDLEEYVRDGGALLLATDRGDGHSTLLRGIDLSRGPLQTLQRDETLEHFPDCPLVTEFEAKHPILEGVTTIATNRPGSMVVLASRRFAKRPWLELARLPTVRSQFAGLDVEGPTFIAAVDTVLDGRAVVIADQSVFSNQMLLYADNARFTANVLRWLAAPDRTTVLILENQSIITPSVPEDVEIEIPPPTPEQVRDALRNLPADVLVEFADTVAVGVEESGMHNEVLAYLMERIPPLAYRRLLWLLPTLLLGLVAFRRMFSEATPDATTTVDSAALLSSASRMRPWLERQHAARELLERFRLDVAGTSAVPWKVFASRLIVTNQSWQTRRLRRAVLKASTRLEPGAQRYWTRRRLEKLGTQIRQWRQLRDSGTLEYKTPASS